MIYKEPNIGDKLYFQPGGRMMSYGGSESYCTVAEMVTFEGYHKDYANEMVFRMLDGNRKVLKREHLFALSGAERTKVKLPYTA